MDELNIFMSELKQQCKALNTNEFEFHWEMWGLNWMPWFVKVDEASLNFSANNISKKHELHYLVEQGEIEILKEYDSSEMDSDQYDRTRYRIMESD